MSAELTRITLKSLHLYQNAKMKRVHLPIFKLSNLCANELTSEVNLQLARTKALPNYRIECQQQ